MKTLLPPTLETFLHWPSWLNARGNLDRSACFELKVSEVRRLAGCVPMGTTKKGKPTRLKGREKFGVADLPHARRAVNGKGRRLAGWWDIDAFTMQWVLDGRSPRGLMGDWRTERSPAMRRKVSQPPGDVTAGDGVHAAPPRRGPAAARGMTLEQGGYGPGSQAYELRESDLIDGLDAGLGGNPNRGACREKKFGLDGWWCQRLMLEQWEHASTSGVQYFLLCPGPGEVTGEVRPCAGGGDEEEASLEGLRVSARLSRVDAKGLRGMTGTTSNCGDGSRGAHGKGWVCGERVYKLFWVLAREEEVRDALVAERWIAGLSSGQLSRGSAEVSALVDRYGPIMGVRALRCRRCLRLRYGQSPEVLRKKRRGAGQ